MAGHGVLHSSVDRATIVASRVPGVIAVDLDCGYLALRYILRYDIDDLMIIGL